MKKIKELLQKLPRWGRILLLTVLGVAVLVGIVVGVLTLVRSAGSSDTVNVYDASNFLMSGDNTLSETQGPVTTDKLQNIYITSTQIVTEMYVKEGDEVHAGDKLLTFDTTLTDLQLERQSIKVQQLGLDIEAAEEELYKISTYNVYDPNAETEEPVEPTPAPLTPVDHMPYLRTGDGSAAAPYRFLWNMDCEYNEDFINALLPGVPVEGDLPTVYAVFEIRDGDSLDGICYQEWMLVFSRNENGGFSFRMADPVPEGTEPTPEWEILPEEDWEYVPTYTWTEIVEMKLNAQKKITDLRLELKKAQLQYDTLKFEMTNGEVVAAIDGVVKSVLDRDTALADNKPLLTVSGGGGYYITAALTEMDLGEMLVGDTVNVTSWQTYEQTQGTITEISEYPDTSGFYYNYSSGNNNVSLYPFTLFVDEDADLREGEWVNVTYDPAGEGGGVYLQDAFIRTEDGLHYIYVRGADDRLEKRYVTIGRTLWGSYIEILNGGISYDDFIAFPYGRDVKPGAKTEQASVDNLYSYY